MPPASASLASLASFARLAPFASFASLASLARLAPFASFASFASLASFALAGCGPTPPAEPTYAAHRAVASAWLEVASPPPAVQPEAVPAAPSERHVWLDGQWLYQRVTGKWTWEPGAWCVPPVASLFYARPAAARVRRVLRRTVRWNTLEGRYEEIDMADDRWSWAKGRFYTGPSRGLAQPSDERGTCVSPAAP